MSFAQISWQASCFVAISTFNEGIDMRPSKLIAYEEYRLRRPLTEAERQAVDAARRGCTTGKRDTVKAMRAALYPSAVGEV